MRRFPFTSVYVYLDAKKAVFFRILASFVLAWATLLPTVSSAAFAPGETLDPGCSPSDVDCTVLQVNASPASGNFGVSTTSPWGLFSINPSGITGPSFVVGSSTLTQFVITNAGNVGIGTTTPQWLLNPTSATASQLSLSAGAGIAQWAFRNAGGNLYFSTTTVAGTATTSIAALTVSGSGFGTTTLRGLDIIGQATSTSNVGLNITGGCFAINGTCVGGSGGASQWTTSGANIYYTTGKVGIGTTTPYAALSVLGEGVFTNVSATSTTATSTFAGGLDVGSGALTYDFSSGITSISNLELGSMSFDANAGIVYWADLPVTSAAADGTVEAYSAAIDGSSILTVYSQSDGAGGIKNSGVGIGTTSPNSPLHVSGAIATAVSVKNGPYTLTANDSVILVDTSGDPAFTLTLPTAVGIAGRTYTIKDKGGNAAIESITIDGAGSETIDGSTTKVLSVNYQGMTIVSNGTNWNTVAQFTTAAGSTSVGDAIGSGTAGSVLFIDASGDLGQDNANFFWDDNNNRLGIGNVAPSVALDVTGAINASGAITGGSLTDGTLTASAGAITGLASVTDGTASWSSSALSGFSSITGTTLTDGTFSVSLGAVTGVTTLNASGAITGGSLTDGTLTASAGAITGATGITSSGTITFSGLTAVSGGETAVCISGGILYDGGGADCTSSSRRFKHDIESLTSSDGLALVMALRPVSFKFNNDGSEHVGFIAEEVADLDPRLTVYEQASTTPRGVRYSEMTAVLAKAIQEQQVQFEQLQSQVGSSTVSASVSSSSVLSILESFGTTISNSIARFRSVFVQTLHIEDQICVDDVCIGKEQLKVLLQGAGATSVAAGAATPASEPTSTPGASDTNAPVIVVSGNNPAHIDLNASYVDLGATVTDDRDQNLGIQVSGDQIDTSVAGEYTVTYSAVDAAGNTATATRTVVVGEVLVPATQPTPEPEAPAEPTESTEPSQPIEPVTPTEPTPAPESESAEAN